MKNQKKKIVLSGLTVAAFLVGVATNTVSKTENKASVQSSQAQTNMLKLARGVQANCCSSSKCESQLS